jgi:hypothetical protein
MEYMLHIIPKNKLKPEMLRGFIESQSLCVNVSPYGNRTWKDDDLRGVAELMGLDVGECIDHIVVIEEIYDDLKESEVDDILLSYEYELLLNSRVYDADLNEEASDIVTILLVHMLGKDRTHLSLLNSQEIVIRYFIYEITNYISSRDCINSHEAMIQFMKDSVRQNKYVLKYNFVTLDIVNEIRKLYPKIDEKITRITRRYTFPESAT